MPWRMEILATATISEIVEYWSPSNFLDGEPREDTLLSDRHWSNGKGVFAEPLLSL